MTQNEKDLLFKDLCARLPYNNTLISIDGERYRMEEIRNALIGINTYKITVDGCNIDSVKPYLFPMSSLSSNHILEIKDILGEDFEIDEYGVTSLFRGRCSSLSYLELNALFEYFNKNNFDYRGIIPMGLANDATGLNIY